MEYFIAATGQSQNSILELKQRIQFRHFFSAAQHLSLFKNNKLVDDKLSLEALLFSVYVFNVSIALPTVSN